MTAQATEDTKQHESDVRQMVQLVSSEYANQIVAGRAQGLDASIKLYLYEKVAVVSVSTGKEEHVIVATMTWDFVTSELGPWLLFTDTGATGFDEDGEVAWCLLELAEKAPNTTIIPPLDITKRVLEWHGTEQVSE